MGNSSSLTRTQLTQMLTPALGLMSGLLSNTRNWFGLKQINVHMTESLAVPLEIWGTPCYVVLLKLSSIDYAVRGRANIPRTYQMPFIAQVLTGSFQMQRGEGSFDGTAPTQWEELTVKAGDRYSFFSPNLWHGQIRLLSGVAGCVVLAGPTYPQRVGSVTPQGQLLLGEEEVDELKSWFIELLN